MKIDSADRAKTGKHKTLGGRSLNSGDLRRSLNSDDLRRSLKSDDLSGAIGTWPTPLRQLIDLLIQSIDGSDRKFQLALKIPASAKKVVFTSKNCAVLGIATTSQIQPTTQKVFNRFNMGRSPVHRVSWTTTSRSTWICLLASDFT